jgi:lipopolysaccharide transport system permease protein
VLGSILSFLPDFGIGLLLVLLSAPLTGAELGTNLLWLPLLVVAMMIPAVAVALPIAGLAVYYRDFKYALPFGVQIWLFASPVAYPVTEISPDLRWLYALVNPVVGMLESFRRIIALGEPPAWGLLGLSTLSATLILLTGFHLFKRIEREFADVV